MNTSLGLDPNLLYESLGLTADETQGQRRTQKRKRVRKDDGRLKRPINSFLLFAREYRAVLLKEYGKLNNQQVSKLLGIKWKAMTEEEREPYTKEAEAIHARFMEAHPDFSWHGDKATSKSLKPGVRPPKRRLRRASGSNIKIQLPTSPEFLESSPPQPQFNRHERSASVGSLADADYLAQQAYEDGELLKQLRLHDAMYASSPESASLYLPYCPAEEVSPRSPSSCSTPSNGTTTEEVLDTGALEQGFAIWRENRPVPEGFKLIYVPLLVRDADDQPSPDSGKNFNVDITKSGLDGFGRSNAIHPELVALSSLSNTSTPTSTSTSMSSTPVQEEGDNMVLAGSAIEAEVKQCFRPIEFDLAVACGTENLQHCCAELGLELGTEYTCLFE